MEARYPSLFMSMVPPWIPGYNIIGGSQIQQADREQTLFVLDDEGAVECCVCEMFGPVAAWKVKRERT